MPRKLTPSQYAIAMEAVRVGIASECSDTSLQRVQKAVQGLEKHLAADPFRQHKTGNPELDKPMENREDRDMWAGEKVKLGRHGVLRFFCLQNVVGAAKLNYSAKGSEPPDMTRADIHNIVKLSPQWDPASFRAITFRTQPGATNLVFPTRCCIIPGCKTVLEMQAGIHTFVHILNQQGTDVYSVTDLRITNYVTCGYINSGQNINLDVLRGPIPNQCSISNVFPGMFV